MFLGEKVPECLSNIIVVTRLLTGEIYGWMLKTTHNLKIHLPSKIRRFIDTHEYTSYMLQYILIYDYCQI